MSFFVLSWEGGSSLAAVDATVRAAIAGAGSDGVAPETTDVALRTVIIDGGRLIRAKLLDPLDQAARDPAHPLRRYFIAQCDDGSECGGYLVQHFDAEKGREITRSPYLPFNTRVP